MVLRFEGDDLSNRYLWQPDAVDQLMADEQIETDEVVWALTDHLGTVRDLAVMDGNETSVVNHITYDSYGNKLSKTSAVDCLFGFTGRAYDEVSEIQNNLNRWYDAKVGRWVSKDPISFEGMDANTYRYVGNDPTNVTDPNGLRHGIVVIWINTKNMPSNFNVKAVEAKMNEILLAEKVNVHVYLKTTTRSKESFTLGWNYDRLTYWGNGAYNWWNPMWWLTATAHDVAYYPWTRNVTTFENYIEFTTGTLGLAITPSSSAGWTEIHPALVTQQLQSITGSNATIAYANILMHEVFWFGVLGKWSDTYGNTQGQLGYGQADSKVPVIMKPWADDINDRF